MGARNILAVISITVIMMVIEVESSLHRVGGGKFSWNSDVNFTDWSNHEQFYFGDWLFFGFNRTVHNILQVNKTSYEECIDTDYIFNITRGGRDVFQLVEPKPYYFICGRGYCLNGMKVAVNVLPQLPPSAPSIPITPASTAATILKTANTFTVAFLSFVFTAFML